MSSFTSRKPSFGSWGTEVMAQVVAQVMAPALHLFRLLPTVVIIKPHEEPSLERDLPMMSKYGSQHMTANT